MLLKYLKLLHFKFQSLTVRRNSHGRKHETVYSKKCGHSLYEATKKGNNSRKKMEKKENAHGQIKTYFQQHMYNF